MSTGSNQVREIADAFAQVGDLKLWSVIVTMFGDRSQHGGGETPGTLLSTIIERMGLQPQAMRVALHRLKRDGWIESRHVARVAYYTLTETGARQTHSVADRVYGSAPDPDQPTFLLLAPPEGFSDQLANVPEDRVFQTSRRIAYAIGDIDPAEVSAVVADLSYPFPEWAEVQLRSAACQEEFLGLTRLLDQLDLGKTGSPVDVLVLRTLVLHTWRRLTLKSHPVAEVALGDHAAALTCRKKVLDALDKLALPDLAALE